VPVTDDSRQMTAQAIRDTDADVICLAEVDNKNVLDDFHAQYLEKSAGVHYGWRRLLEGNDRRGIDVAVMARDRITVTSHAELTFDEVGLFNAELDAYGLHPGDRVFRRDCLEVELKVGDKPLTLFACHFKSMSGGREETMPVRTAEAAAVRWVVENKFGQADAAKKDWIILGDLNDYTHVNGTAEAHHGLEPLFDGGFSVNLVEHLPVAERWTHYYPSGGEMRQLDYILASPALAKKNANARPEIVRGGQPYRVPGIEAVPRYPRVGFDRPKASDHCPVVVELKV